MAGPGDDHRRRSDGVPGRVQRHEPRDALADAGDQQDHDADLDVRPPHHPGRPVRRVPAPRARAAARRRRSTTRSSRRCASRTSRCAGWSTGSSPTRARSTRAPGSIELINAYRTNGHLMADTDPLEYTVRTHPDLDITRHGLTLWDLDRDIPGRRLRRREGHEAAGHPRRAARRVLPQGRRRVHAHHRSRAAALAAVRTSRSRATVPNQERAAAHPRPAQRGRGLRDVPADQVRRVSSRFSLEGAETVIPLLDAVLAPSRRPARLDEVVIGMPHRGRLNVLANIVGKPYGKIFNEFEGNIDPGHGAGLRRRQVPPRLARHVHARRAARGRRSR